MNALFQLGDVVYKLKARHSLSPTFRTTINSISAVEIAECKFLRQTQKEKISTMAC